MMVQASRFRGSLFFLAGIGSAPAELRLDGSSFGCRISSARPRSLAADKKDSQVCLGAI
jgi:hypothetical protein